MYSGGSIVAGFASHRGGLLESAKIHAAVRSKEQAQSLSKLDVSVLQIDLSDQEALTDYVLVNDSQWTPVPLDSRGLIIRWSSRYNYPYRDLYRCKCGAESHYGSAKAPRD